MISKMFSSRRFATSGVMDEIDLDIQMVFMEPD